MASSLTYVHKAVRADDKTGAETLLLLLLGDLTPKETFEEISKRIVGAEQRGDLLLTFNRLYGTDIYHRRAGDLDRWEKEPGGVVRFGA